MLQRKTISLSDVDLKMEGETGKFAGYASTFGGVDSYGDTIIKGAYDYTLRTNGKPKMFVNHDSSALPVGKYLVAKEDDHGLWVEGEFTPGSKLAEEVRAALKHGTVDGLSIGYALKSSDYEDAETGGRIIRRVSRLAEVSIVTFPADDAARVDLGSVKNEGFEQAIADMKSIRDFEYLLRDAGGFSKGAAQALTARVKTLLASRDAEQDDDEAKQMQMVVDRLNLIAA